MAKGYDGNDLAVDVSEIEAGKQEISIAQVKQTVKSLGHVLIRRAHGDVIDAAAIFAELVLESAAAEYAKSKG